MKQVQNCNYCGRTDHNIRRCPDLELPHASVEPLLAIPKTFAQRLAEVTQAHRARELVLENEIAQLRRDLGRLRTELHGLQCRRALA